jgi:hypothetical protein
VLKQPAVSLTRAEKKEEYKMEGYSIACRFCDVQRDYCTKVRDDL